MNYLLFTRPLSVENVIFQHFLPATVSIICTSENHKDILIII